MVYYNTFPTLSNGRCLSASLPCSPPIVRKYAERAGLERIGPHVMREDVKRFNVPTCKRANAFS